MISFSYGFSSGNVSPCTSSQSSLRRTSAPRARVPRRGGRGHEQSRPQCLCSAGRCCSQSASVSPRVQALHTAPSASRPVTEERARPAPGRVSGPPGPGHVCSALQGAAPSAGGARTCASRTFPLACLEAPLAEAAVVSDIRAASSGPRRGPPRVPPRGARCRRPPTSRRLPAVFPGCRHKPSRMRA